ncbi:MAG: hypothetical protein CVU56_01760 [Deltaproteobacteria bacterium HGW-Deltaproteobacteria-14]|jgi:hypothetical protein|nr:MAG: hypothetical protein CVU56_01760 [Deltaproteobacteria bacterium HGW-Deltaproteobacteria-14]
MIHSLARLSPITAPLALALALGAACGAATSAAGDTESPLVDVAEDVVGVDTPADDAADTAVADTAAPACTARATVAPVAPFFSDVSLASGIRVGNYDEHPPVAVPINDHSRVAWADLDGDGWDDIVAHSLYPNPQAGVPFDHVVLLNNHDGTFRDHAAASGLRDVQAAIFVFGDVDNDGDQDLFAGLDVPLPGQRSAIYLNDGAGVFTRRDGSGVDATSVPTYAANAMFLDYDGDGALDLFVGQGHTSYAVPDSLFHGNGDGTFTDVSALLQSRPAQPTNGTVTCDYDNDGDLDLIVGTYGVSSGLGANQLWDYDAGTFTDVGVATGFASQATGNRWIAATGYGADPEPGKGPGTYIGSNTFGVDCGDINNDGLMDIAMGTISHPGGDYTRTWSDPTQLLINQGPRGPASQITFVDKAAAWGVPYNEGDLDLALADFDNDGLLDVAIGRENKYESGYTDQEQMGWLGLMHQLAGHTFESLGTVSGLNDLDAAYVASLTECVEGDTCPDGEACLASRCRTPCTTTADCPSAQETCHTGGFCRLLTTAKRAQNIAWADYDHDGDLDLLVGGRDLGGGRPNFLFRNDIGHQNRWLGFRLVGDGVKVNRDAVGARVTVHAGDEALSREIRSSRGLSSTADGRTAYFGLGDRGCGYTVEVRWPDGTTVTLPAGAVVEERLLTVRYPDAIE